MQVWGVWTMYIVYYDESGDDGYPKTSSSLFVLTALYLHHLEWKAAFGAIHEFRRRLAASHGLPFSMEFHTREFLLDKKPYRGLGLSRDHRVEILRLFCDLAANLNVRIVNVAIDKRAIRRPDYAVLDKAFTYSIQRIENDLGKDGSRFLIITDEGRVGKMRAIARRVQKYNPIASKYGDRTYRKEIEHLVEDPLPKNSRESFFIQLADMVSYLVGLHQRARLGHEPVMPSRLADVIEVATITECLDMLLPSLNTAAAPGDKHGIVCYPKA